MFSVTCSIQKGSQPFVFQWYKNGDLIKSSDRYEVQTFSKLTTLNIDKVTRLDSGNYTCLVKNSVGSDSQNVLFTVKGMYFSSISLT